MNYGVLFCLILAHVAGDFLFQKESIIRLRYSKGILKQLKGNEMHALVYLIITLLCSLYYFSLKSLLFILILTVSHFIIDLVKSIIVSKNSLRQYSIAIFLVDQFLHFSAIIAVSAYISNHYTSPSILNPVIIGIKGLLPLQGVVLTYSMKVFLAVILILVDLWGVGVFIRLFFNYLKYKSPEAKYKKNIESGIIIIPQQNGGTRDGGFLIGILERLFIITSIVLLKPEFIGFVLTAKSIARFKKFDDDSFVEIFIIGTFISFITAIFTGIIIKKLNIIP